MFSPPPTSKETASERSRHASRHVRHARAVMHVGIANPRWRGKRSWHSRRMRNPQFYVSGKRPFRSLKFNIANETSWRIKSINQSIKSSFVKGAGARPQNAPCWRCSHALRGAPVRRGRLLSTVLHR